MIPIRTALISVSDKTGLAEFARGLGQFKIKILSTGGTAKLLSEQGIPVTEVADYTGFPEMLDGRVKTLHPRLHAGILARRDSPAHLAAIKAAGIEPIDLVVVNLYPFAKTVARHDCKLADAIENIDVGGPSMLRAGAKNYAGVAVVTDPSDYSKLLVEMKESGGTLSDATRFALAQKAFAHSAAYEAAISNYLTGLASDGKPSLFPGRLTLQFEKVQDLRYGENPHQAAAFYRDGDPVPGGIAAYTQIQGKELSYNNIADADAAWECVKTFDEPACVIVKHANPCGAAISNSVEEAYERAFATDPISAFGGIVAFNRGLDAATAEAVSKQFVEVVIAPEIEPQARKVLAAKTNVRVLSVRLARNTQTYDLKRVGGGLLAQTPDQRNVAATDLRTVTRSKPTPAQLADLLFAWRVAKFVKSNAIVFCAGGRTLGIGAGQMSRVDAARVAVSKAQAAGLPLAGSVVASDAFFPFRDGVEVVAQAGAQAVIQPGGSVRDDEVIAAADELGVAMVFTGVRHFRH
ncbi:MAG TPA: bifunctional phosphoribosylaminoimidazolecarboxamide formyltransferase/IMP cyclohydrolase [Burkholderiales bacterium]|nr:bifunctional phosphoribosylaminoimidazolecarboxamide formyltransferase/IMP cyclohydrolase [Burkholderiales bacterium]